MDDLAPDDPGPDGRGPLDDFERDAVILIIAEAERDAEARDLILRDCVGSASAMRALVLALARFAVEGFTLAAATSASPDGTNVPGDERSAGVAVEYLRRFYLQPGAPGGGDDDTQ